MTFEELNLPHEIARAINQMHYTQVTQIQQEAIPEMRKGRDIIAKAPTGTGKTFAFGIPLIEGIDEQNRSVQALVLAPTRELTIQISEQLRLLARYKNGVRVLSVYGGQPISKQIEALKRRPNVVVATPGRLIDLMNRKAINLDGVTLAVLDEADEMLDMGFIKDVRGILDRLPSMKQMAMFSATISREVMDIGWLYQRDAAEITVEPELESMPLINQYAIECSGGSKFGTLLDIMECRRFRRVIIFCNTKRMAERLYTQLAAKGFCVDCLHGDIRQSTRNRIMQDFKNGDIDVLVATDVAARGIDVSGIDAVFSYDVPQENAYYLHRIGRTGRARNTGDSYIFYTLAEKFKLDDIIRLTKSDVTFIRLNNAHKIETIQ
ncbi:MAG: DEAD/DEAH box helicase [Firmicutes bacterium]|nr:DEAD/DEAH box helicase [Bacillota bacterium]